MTTPEEAARGLVDEVVAATVALGAAVEGLRVHQEGQIARTRRALKWTIGGLVVDLVLTVFGAVLFVSVDHNTRELKRVNQRTSTQALCPLYEVFLRAYNPQSPQAQADPATYERNFSVIEQGARAMGCTKTTRGR